MTSPRWRRWLLPASPLDSWFWLGFQHAGCAAVAVAFCFRHEWEAVPWPLFTGAWMTIARVERRGKR